MTADGRDDDSVEGLTNLAAGSDEPVYEDVDVDALPEWWRRAIREHEAYGLRPYRPPRFADDAICPPVVQHVEEVYGVSIQLRGKNVSPGDQWAVFVDGSLAFEVGRRRDPNGYTVLEMSRDEFLDRIERYLAENEDGSRGDTS
jgi:hypothetical protein